SAENLSNFNGSPLLWDDSLDRVHNPPETACQAQSPHKPSPNPPRHQYRPFLCASCVTQPGSHDDSYLRRDRNLSHSAPSRRLSTPATTFRAVHRDPQRPPYSSLLQHDWPVPLPRRKQELPNARAAESPRTNKRLHAGCPRPVPLQPCLRQPTRQPRRQFRATPRRPFRTRAAARYPARPDSQPPNP